MNEQSAGDTEHDEEYWKKYPHTTVRGVPVTESTAGVDVTLIDLSRIDEPPMILLQEYYPPEDDVEGDTVGVHGLGEAVELASTILELLSPQFEMPAMDRDELEDDVWTRYVEPEIDSPTEGSDDE
jgi:hypothetical protein